MAKARIIEGASSIFMKRTRKVFKNMPLPKHTQVYYEKIKQLEGKVLEIDREYNDRIVLHYTPDLIELLGNGTMVVAIDLEKDLTERV